MKRVEASAWREGNYQAVEWDKSGFREGETAGKIFCREYDGESYNKAPEICRDFFYKRDIFCKLCDEKYSASGTGVRAEKLPCYKVHVFIIPFTYYNLGKMSPASKAVASKAVALMVATS